MQLDYPELRAYLAQEENFEVAMKKSPYMCTIKDNNTLTALEMLNWNSKINPSSIIVMMPDSSYKEFWLDVYEDQQNIPYEERLSIYPEYYIIY